MRNWEQVDKSAKYLIEKYPELCKINTSKKRLDKETKKILTEIKFIKVLFFIFYLKMKGYILDFETEIFFYN